MSLLDSVSKFMSKARDKTTTGSAKYVGVSSSHHTCDLCGKTGLKQTVVMESRDGARMHLGSECAKARDIAEAELEPEFEKKEPGKRLANISDSDRIIFSPKEITRIEDVEQKTNQRSSFKPRGLWYAKGRAWLRWMEGETPEWIGSYKYAYSIQIDPSKILFLGPEDILKFTKEYRLSTSSSDYIDWILVAQKYDGIEIDPYSYEWKYRKIDWYNGWDLPSGCIWRARSVTGIEKLDCTPKDCAAGGRLP